MFSISIARNLSLELNQVYLVPRPFYQIILLQELYPSFLSFPGMPSYYQKRDHLSTTFPITVSDTSHTCIYRE